MAQTLSNTLLPAFYVRSLIEGLPLSCRRACLVGFDHTRVRFRTVRMFRTSIGGRLLLFQRYHCW